MAFKRRYLFAALGVAAFSVATSGFALTLGRADGTVNLGQALKLTVPVQMEAGETASTQCFEADVFYGETRQDASRVSVSSDVGPVSRSLNATVSSSTAVDEPVVTVYLRAGCERKTSRRYVLLTELAQATAPSANMARVVTQPLLKHPPQDAPRVASQTAAKESLSAPFATKRVKSVPKADARRSRLRLAPIDLTQEFEPNLKISDQLIVDGTEDLQKRARASVLWGALNATPQEIVSAEGRRQAIEQDIKNLQGMTIKNGQLLQAMTARLDQAESDRYANALVYGLLVAIAVICLVIAFLWNRTRQAVLANEPWWQDDVAADKPEAFELPSGSHAQVHGGEAIVDKKVTVPPLPHFADLDIDLRLDDPVEPFVVPASPSPTRRDPVRAKPNQQRPRAAGHVDFGHSMSATLLRSVNSKELLDVRQQADFFMTLGQHDEAIALLRDNLEDDTSANPLVYLELLKILHTLGHKPEYDHYRQGFNTLFSGHVPVYADFNQGGSGLEAYPDVCEQIVAVWPSVGSISFIENCLLRTHMESGGQAFDLEAFRDLLMLHAVASRMASASFDSGFVAFSAAKTVPMPVSAAPQADVDVDLSESHDGNLIDFDTSDWSPPPPSGVKTH